MRLLFLQTTMAARPADSTVLSSEQLDDSEFWKHFAEPMFVYPFMSYYYGGLYVLIEGWRELRLSDPTIDDLLQSPHVDALRKYRNGSFHFQPDYFNDRLLALLPFTDSPQWIQAVRNAFSAWFLKHFNELEKEGSG